MNIIEKVQKELASKGHILKSKEAIIWLRNHAIKADPKDILKLRTKQRNGIALIGRMFFFTYDPKTKDKLPFYDTFPLVIPVEIYQDGFLGLNLHYLPHGERLNLFQKLQEYQNNTKLNDTTKLKLSYDLLQATKRLRAYKPCLKRYLGGHITSRMVEIEPLHWEIALFLPVERFVGASKNKIHKTSMKAYT